MSELFDYVLERKKESIIFALVTGIITISLGVFLVGSQIYSFLGSRFIIFGSFIFYISIVLLVFILE